MPPSGDTTHSFNTRPASLNTVITRTTFEYRARSRGKVLSEPVAPFGLRHTNTAEKIKPSAHDRISRINAHYQFSPNDLSSTRKDHAERSWWVTRNTSSAMAVGLAKKLSGLSDARIDRVRGRDTLPFAGKYQNEIPTSPVHCSIELPSITPATTSWPSACCAVAVASSIAPASG